MSITKSQRRNSRDHQTMLAEHAPDQKASERFHKKPYESYTVTDYLKKMGVDINKHREE